MDMFGIPAIQAYVTKHGMQVQTEAAGDYDTSGSGLVVASAGLIAAPFRIPCSWLECRRKRVLFAKLRAASWVTYR